MFHNLKLSRIMSLSTL